MLRGYTFRDQGAAVEGLWIILSKPYAATVLVDQTILSSSVNDYRAGELYRHRLRLMPNVMYSNRVRLV